MQGLLTGTPRTNELVLIGIFLRTMFVWWVVSYWATTRYRKDIQAAASVGNASDSSVRSKQRATHRNLSLRYFFHWFCGAILISLSGIGILADSGSHRYSASEVIVFLIAVVCISLLFASVEMLTTGRFRTFLKTLTWLLALGVTLLFCTGGRHPESFVSELLRLVIVRPTLWMLGLAYFFVVFPVGDWVGRFMDRWAVDGSPEQGLPGGGKWIGRLERMLVVTCLLAGQPAGVAIVVIAKAALRYGQIRHNTEPGQQRKMVEHILVGSMLSFLLALITGLIAAAALTMAPPLIR